jgi:hypothetical protein
MMRGVPVPVRDGLESATLELAMSWETAAKAWSTGGGFASFTFLFSQVVTINFAVQARPR